MGQIDYTKVPDSVKQKIAEAELKKPSYLQLMALQDIAAMTQELLSAVEDKGSMDQVGTLLVDIRESLQAIKSKDDPELPDFSKPVVDAIEKLQKAFDSAIKKVDVKPEVNVKAPIVNVDAPEVDLSGVEKILNKDLPKAFGEAISKIPKVTIPKTNFKPLEEKLADMLEWLESIDTAVRMKPQPGTMKVTNPDGSNIGGGGGGSGYSKPLDEYALVQYDDTSDPTNYEYYAYMAADGDWTIKRTNMATNLNEYTAPVATSYATGWTNRASLTYLPLDGAF